MSAKQDLLFFVVVFGINICMQIHEVLIKPKTPEQQRILSLKSAKDRAGDALAAERKRQQVKKAQQALATATQTAAIKSNVS
jgi:hypothetical protein